MKINEKSCAVFKSSIPDDSIESNDEIVAPAGRNILTIIYNHTVNDSAVIDQPLQHSFYGWEMSLKIENITIFVLLQRPNDWLLIAEARASWWISGAIKRRALSRALVLINSALSSDPRITELQWMTATDFNARQSQAKKIISHGNEL